MEKKYDVAILGGGPGGYVAGIRAAQLGLSACVIEKDALGGVCLNWGCIPSKSLIHQAAAYLALRDMEVCGVKVDRSGFRYAAVQARSREAARTLSTGVSGLLRKNKVDVINAKGTIDAPFTVGLDRGMGAVRATNIILATGSRPSTVSGFDIDEEQVLSSAGLLALTDLPRTLIVLGAGAIGCEFAYVMNAFGVDVTLLEIAPQILPTSDAEVAAVLERAFRSRGIKVRTACRALSLERSSAGIEVSVEEGGVASRFKADKVLVALGRTPNTQGIGLERASVACDSRGFIKTRDYYETSVPGIFAIGDVIDTPGLAHLASREGETVVDYLAGHTISPRIDAALVPSVVYCEPQVASFGLTEQQAREKQVAVRKSVFPYRGSGKAVAISKPDGLVKILAAPDTGEILGAHIVGSDATELIHELLLAKQAELLVEDIQATVHAHPTLSESLMEAARGVFGRPIHL